MKFLPGILLFFAASVAAFAAEGAAPVIVDSPSGAISSEAAIVENSRRALDSGMPALARIMLERMPLSSPELKREAALVLADSMISEGRYDEARKSLAEFGSDKSANMELRRAVLSVAARDGHAPAILAGIKPGDLDRHLLPWYYISLGMVDFDAGKFSAALDNFEKARELARAPAVEAEADILASLCKISQDLKADNLESLAGELSVKSAVFMGMPAGAQYAKQQAIVLDRLGRKKEALEAVENQLQIPLITDSDRDELRLIGAYINPSVERRRATLLEILKSTDSPEITEQAVHMMRYAYDYDSPEYESALESALESASNLVKDRILLELAYLSLRKDDYPRVDAYIGRLLSDYPASIYALDAHRILAFSAFSSGPSKKPDYRLAASELLKAASLDKNAESASIARFIAADCYFLEKDYETAAAMYGAALDSTLPDKWKSGAFGRAMESLLALDRMDSAVALLDSLRGADGIGSDDIWRAEWSLASAYRRNGEPEKASARIDMLLAGPVSAAADPALRARLLWLQARMVENSGDYARALQLANSLLELMNSGRLDVGGELAGVIVSNTMFMRARLLALLGVFEGEGSSFAAYDALRTAYSDSDAAQLSYIYEARDQAMRGLFAQAQQNCKTLADNFPDGKYADTALLDAAMYSQKLGLESDWRDALQLLDRLVKNYPDSPKVFNAKLAYAQVLRLMNDYANAAAVYRNIVDEFPSHPRILAAKIGIGDCLYAAGQESDAASVYERLYAAPSTPKEAEPEIAFKWGFALDRAGRKSEAARIWWICASEILEGKTDGKRTLGANESMWIARSLLMLADSLEKGGEPRSAIAAYELMIRHKLPGSYRARERLSKHKEK